MKTSEMEITSDARARFFSKVDKNGPAVSHVDGLDPCWVWTASRFRNGYGAMKVDGRMLRAHRLSWAIHNGPIPLSMCVLHRCDVPGCVNPAHLFLGTKADNMRDCVAKGRFVQRPAPPGEGHHLAKLTDANVLEIRKLYAAGGISQRKLGERFGVAQTNISLIVLRGVWTHL